MKHSIITDVQSALKALLLKEAPSSWAGSPKVDIEFASSWPEIENMKPKDIICFLYRMGENKHFRNSSPTYTAKEKRPAPLCIELHYLFLPRQKSRTKGAKLETGLYEWLMQTFYDHPVLRPAEVQPSNSQGLEAAGNEEIRIVPEDLDLSDLTRLWGLLPGKEFQLTLAYKLTPIFVPSSRIETVTPVQRKEVRYRSMDEEV